MSNGEEGKQPGSGAANALLLVDGVEEDSAIPQELAHHFTGGEEEVVFACGLVMTRSPDGVFKASVLAEMELDGQTWPMNPDNVLLLANAVVEEVKMARQLQILAEAMTSQER